MTADLFETFAGERLTGSIRNQVIENLPSMDPDLDDLVAVNWRAKHGHRKRGNRIMAYAPAAALVLLLATAAVLKLYWPSADTHREPVGVVIRSHGETMRYTPSSDRFYAFAEDVIQAGDTFETGMGSNLALSLLGQSRVRVQDQTRVSIDEERTIDLEAGEAWFRVSRNGEPFTVQTPRGDVTVLGTVFSVAVNELATVVTVERGAVRVTHRGDSIELSPGEQVRVTDDVGFTHRQGVEVARLTDWANSWDVNLELTRGLTRDVRPNEGTVDRADGLVFRFDDEFNRLALSDRKWVVAGVRLYWDGEETDPGHVSYTAYVYADGAEPVFKAFVDGRVFADPDQPFYEIPVPGAPLDNVTSLEVRLVPEDGAVSGPSQNLTAKAVVVPSE
jgi:hypothetical protein